MRRSVKDAEGRFPWLNRLVHNSWFEPMITILAVGAVLLALYGYTGNWPPLVVVESSSMQHGTGDTIGDINTGDLVLVKQENVPNQVVTYVQGEGTGGGSGYMTYGEYGDVLLYYRYGQTDTTPIIHRAIIWLSWMGDGDFAAPTLANLTCGPQGQYQVVPPDDSQQNAPCPTVGELDSSLTGTIWLYNVGWQAVTVEIPLSMFAVPEASPVGGTIPPHSGFITMGDDNCKPQNPTNTCQEQPGEQGVFDQIGGITVGLVYPSWVEGVARGMIPWFGAIKLWLSGDAYFVPSQTWEYLGLTIFAIIVIPTVVPRLVRFTRTGSWSRPSENEVPTGAGDPRDSPGASPTKAEGETPAESPEIDQVR